jgi:TonB-dependent receptor
MKKQYAFLLFSLLFSIASFSQNGNIQGTIIDEQGLPIPFGNVVIEALKQGVISDADGKFLFVDIPEGKQIIKVTYIGYADSETEVNVESGLTKQITITIIPTVLELDGVVITGYNSSQAKALNAQKNKQNITNIISTDQIGKFPDANIGDALKRVPGITMQVDQGEARNIIIRGLAPQLNSVTLNGSRIPSAEGDNRNVQMDLIPSDMIQLIEVNKAVTPDMDADALGGSVNLVTRTSPNGFRVAATVGSGVNLITDKRILNGSFLIGDRTKNDKLGWMISTSINDSDFGSDNIEFEWDDSKTPYVKESDIRTYLVQRIRRSFSANLDYAFNTNNTISLKTMYNWRDDRENRFRLRYKDIELIDKDNPGLGYQAEIRRQTKGGIDNNRNKNTRLEDQRVQNYALNGNHIIGKAELDWMGSFSKASEERLNERYIEYRNKDVEIIPNLSNPEFPFFSPRNIADVNPSEFSLKEITDENKYTDEKDYNFYANLKFPTSLFGKGGFVKLGSKLRFKNKERSNNYFEYEDETGVFKKFSDQTLVDQTDADFLAGSRYVAGLFVDPAFLGKLNFDDTNLFKKVDVPSEYARANFKVKEDVIASYIMINEKLSDKLSLLAGLRLENTNVEATGNQIEGEENILGTITKKSNYTNVLPGVHFKYNVSNNTVLRFAWTNTLARPNYADLVPSIDVVTDDEEVVLGNPDLDATTSMGFDLMAEHYFKNVGIISGGVFQKNIKDFVYTFQTEVANDAYGTGTTGYDSYQPQNGDDANILGAEISIQRRLDFLPSIAKNLSVMLNYTYLTSSADGIRNSDGEERTDVDLPGTAPNMFNGSLAYSDKKLSLRLSANYSDSYIDEIGGKDLEDRYYDEQFLLDFNASYTINNAFSVYFDLNNITDQPLRYFQGVKSRTMQLEHYGRRITFGLKYDLFKKKS